MFFYYFFYYDPPHRIQPDLEEGSNSNKRTRKNSRTNKGKETSIHPLYFLITLLLSTFENPNSLHLKTQLFLKAKQYNHTLQSYGWWYRHRFCIFTCILDFFFPFFN
jgi:hypothetical protein